MRYLFITLLGATMLNLSLILLENYRYGCNAEFDRTS